jgi:hypothetical protein
MIALRTGSEDIRIIVMVKRLAAPPAELASIAEPVARIQTPQVLSSRDASDPEGLRIRTKTILGPAAPFEFLFTHMASPTSKFLIVSG